MINRRDFLRQSLISTTGLTLAGWNRLADDHNLLRNTLALGCGHSIP
jgi:hypothetical protein